jgi:hypothetical protein
VSAPDITRNLHGGNENSEQANLLFEPHKDTLAERVFWATANRGTATLKELSVALCEPEHKVSPRLSELKATGFLKEVCGVRRDGCAVLRTVKPWNAAEFHRLRCDLREAKKQETAAARADETTAAERRRMRRSR